MKEELEIKEAVKKERSVLVPFLVGGLVGAGLAVLFAPKSGKETRADIKDLAGKTKEKIVSTIDKGREIYQESTNALTGAIEAGKAAYKTAYVEEKERQIKAA